jgi:hypothetical protein
MPGNPIQSSGRGLRTAALRAAIVVPAFLLALAFGRHVLAITYAIYDDEGYMLLSFSHYFAGGHLYTEVFAQYGPFNFFAERFLFWLLHLPVTHDASRLVTLICWLLSAVLGGTFVFRISKNTILASAAGLAITIFAAILAREPGHPQQLILPLLLLGCCAALSRRPANLIQLGLLGTALFFIKINVGVFYFAAVLQTLVCQFPPGRIRSLGAGLSLLFAAAGPFVLMRQDVHEWALGYCLLAIACGVSTLIVAFLAAPPSPAPARSVLWAAAGALAAAALIWGETVREGMSFHTLAEGVLWAPLRHPRVFEVPLQISMKKLFVALAVSACILVLFWLRRRWQSRAGFVNALRCAIGLCVIVLLISFAWVPRLLLLLHFRSVVLLTVLLPLGLIPAEGASWRAADFSPRLFVTSLAATQVLQAYPVAGSQLSIALTPLLLWAFVCVHDGIGGLFVLVRRVTNEFGTDAHGQESFVGGLVALGLAGLMLLLGAWPGRFATPPSSLPGSASLHLPRELEDRYEALAADIRANCSALFTMPGMGSLNFWSGVPAPNGLNMTAWMRAFSPEQEQQILGLLKSDPQSCVVYNEGLAHFWGSTHQDLVAIPLAHYILFDMREVHREDGYAIFVEPQRNSPWIEAGAARQN